RWRSNENKMTVPSFVGLWRLAGLDLEIELFTTNGRQNYTCRLTAVCIASISFGRMRFEDDIAFAGNFTHDPNAGGVIFVFDRAIRQTFLDFNAIRVGPGGHGDFLR